jgi:gluconokinase
VSSQRPSVLSIDVGSPSVRAGLFDDNGEPVAGTASRRPHRFVIGPGGRVEADPDALTRLVTECIDESLQWPSAAGREIAAVAFASFLHGMIGTDGEGRALTPVITWADFRSVEQADRLGLRMDPEEVRQRTGCPLHPVYFPSKLLWVRENQPQIFKDVDWWCSIGEHCFRRFTGRTSCSLSMASGFGLLDRRTGCWDGELLAGLGVDESRFSPLGDLDSPVRGLRSPYANRWPGLRDSAWFPALGDGACSNVGCGSANGDRIALMIGTTGAMRAVRPAGDAHIPEGLWVYRMDRTRELVGGVLGDGGNLFEWMSTTLDLGLTPKEIDVALLAAAPAGHGLTVLPFFTGERSTGWNPRARGAVIDLRLETKGLDLLQAGVEAIAYRFAAILRVLRPAAPDARDVIGTGRALRSSAAWGQILADVLELPLSCADEPEASSRGAAVLVLEALGLISNADAARPRIARTFFPRAGTTAAHRAAAVGQEHLRVIISSSLSSAAAPSAPCSGRTCIPSA